MGDILRTTLVLGAIVLGLFLVGKVIFSSTPDNPTSEVDYLLAASGVEDSTGFDPLVAPELDKNWRATVATFDGNRWRYVVTTPEKEFISFEQATLTARELLMASDVEHSRGKSIDIAGETWGVGKDKVGNTAYFREVDGQTLLVVSSAKPATVTAYIESLVPFSSLS